MKKTREIRWGTPVGIKQFHTARFGTERSLPGELSLFLLSTLLFFGATFGMLQNMFEWQLLTEVMLLRIFFTAAVVSGLTEAASLLKPRLCGMARAGILVIGTAGSLFYLLRTKQGERLLGGLQAVASSYVGYWNRYYNAALWVEKGRVMRLEESLGFVFGVLCFLTVWYSRVKRKNGIAVIFPLLAFLAGSLVGETPTGGSLFVAAAAVFLANAASFRGAEFLAAPDKHGREAGRFLPFLWVPVAAGVLLLCLVVKGTGNLRAEDAVENGKLRLQRKNDEILQEITEWTGWQDVNVAESVEQAVQEFFDRKEIETGNDPEANFAKLDNTTPEYEDVAVLRMALEKKPSSGAYLIGFYADNYDDGVWDTDVKAFEKQCERAGFDPKTVSDGLITLAAERAAMYYGKESLTEFSYWGINGWMYYAKANRIKAYMPYFAEAKSEVLQTEGDSRYIKEKNVTKVPFALWNYNVDEIVRVLFRGNETANAWEKEPWEVWYESYVTRAYLDVQEGMTQVAAVAEEIRNWEREFFVVEGKDSVNFDRINKAYQVADWMRQNTAYSLELPELPKGSDPIEFFLGTSRQGYCMHYAGAAVLILRELGVPARYASGYVAGDFKWDEVSRMYEAVVMDSSAHAWTEIYLEGIGWVPVEVTKGYSVLPAGTQIYEPTENGSYKVTYENWEDVAYPYPGQQHWQDTTPFVTPAPTPTPEPDEVRSEEPEATPQPSEEADDEVSGNENANDSSPAEDTESSGDDRKEKKKDAKVDLSVNPVVLVFALPVIAIFLGVIVPLSNAYRRAKGKSDAKKIQKKTKWFDNRRKIKLINERLYRKLRGRGKIYKKHIRDEEYEEILQKHGGAVPREERERYMHLVKAAAFSYNSFTEEEVAFCKEIYRKVLYEKRNKEDDE